MTGHFRPHGCRRLAAALLLPFLLLLSGCTGDPQDTLTRHGVISDRITNLYLIVFILIRYRQRRTDDRLPAQTHGSTPLEITWTIVPVLILAALAIPTVRDI